GKGNGGEGIWESRDDSGLSGDGGGDEGSAASTASMNASVAVDIGVWGWTDILALQSVGDGDAALDRIMAAL
ncbi:hypothetical protein Tco_0238078, partial [Tanacetum coccineum]